MKRNSLIPGAYFNVYPLLDQTLSLIKIAHANQVYNGLPYWHHPVRVLLRLNWNDLLPDDVYAALLHDTLEDTAIDEDDLRAFGYTESTIRTVRYLTRDEDDSYKEYVRKIGETRDSKIIRIKLADLFENSNNIRFLPPEKRGRLVRYGKSIEDLQLALRQCDIKVKIPLFGELDVNEVKTWIGEQPSFL